MFLQSGNAGLVIKVTLLRVAMPLDESEFSQGAYHHSPSLYLHGKSTTESQCFRTGCSLVSLWPGDTGH